MSIHLDAMLYTSEGKTHRLFPVCVYREHGFYVIEASMYTEEGEFIGTWPRKTMPMKLINMLQRHHTYIRSFRPDDLRSPDPEESENT